jgi:multicomponent Na+:H+ antiporter subunit E
MSNTIDVPHSRRRGSLGRAAGFFAFWLSLAGISPSDIMAGILAAGIATWASLSLLPLGQRRFRPVAITWLFVRFVRQSISAGIDVAWRALDPRLPLRPGLAIYQSRLPPGLTRSAFCTVTSLLPGTLPCGTDEGGSLIIHCLDVNQPVAEQLAAEEGRLGRALTGGAYYD